MAQPELRAAIEALQLAEGAQNSRSSSKRSKALAALEAAREGLLAAERDSWHREAATGQWSNARGRKLRANLRAAAASLQEVR